MAVKINTEEFSGKWVIALKALAGLVMLALPFILSLQSWLVVESFEHQTSLAIVDQKLNAAAAEGPHHTKIQSDLADMKQTKEIMTQVTSLIQPLVFSIHALDKRLDNHDNE